MHARTTLTWALTVLTTLAACELPTRPRVAGENTASRLAVSPKVLTLQQNQAVDLMAVGFTSAGDTADVAVTWSAASGLITDTSTNNGRHYGRYWAGSDTGQVKVVARGNPGEIADTAVVTVTLTPVASLTVSPASASLVLGATRQLSAVTQDAAGNTLSGRAVTWSSNAPAIATVSSTGLVSGLALGAATIAATSEGVSGTAAVTIAPASTHIGSPNLEPGLLGRSDLVLFEDFEFADWLNHWSGGYVVDPATLSRTTSPVFQGSQGLEVRVPNGEHYGVDLDFAFGKKGLPEPEEIYLRYYVRFNDTWQTNVTCCSGQLGKLPGFSGTYGRCGWGSGGVDGTCWSARMVSYDVGTSNKVGFYSYHMDGDNQYGETILWQPTLARGPWYCVEAQVKMNSISNGSANYDGVLRGWIDGAPAFERTNLRFRNVSTTKIEKIWWNVYIGGTWTADRDMALHFDNVVVAKQRIGCYSASTP